jgi:hypothetical protein
MLWDHHVVILHLLDRRMTDIAEVVGGVAVSIKAKLTGKVFSC